MTLLKYIQEEGVVVGVSAGSIIFAENLKENLGLLKARMEVHCTEWNEIGNIEFPVKNTLKLTNTQALAIWDVERQMEIIGK